jgi:hypothetical protein
MSTNRLNKFFLLIKKNEDLDANWELARKRPEKRAKQYIHFVKEQKFLEQEQRDANRDRRLREVEVHRDRDDKYAAVAAPTKRR